MINNLEIKLYMGITIKKLLKFISTYGRIETQLNIVRVVGCHASFF